MRLAVIRNPAAGGRRRALYDTVLARLDAAGCALSVVETGGPGDAEALAAELAGDGVERLVVAGGDGTVNEVVNGLARASAAPELALIPLGTANVLAHEIGLAASPAAIAETILEGRARPVTLGEVNGRRFVLMAGIGIDAHVVAGLDARLKRRLGKAAYAWSFLRRLVEHRCPTYRYRIGDGDEASAAGLVLANARTYGGVSLLTPRAGLELASLALCVMPEGAPVVTALRVFSGAYGRREGAAAATVERLEVLGPEGEPVQADGDIVATLPVVIRALPAALRLVYPATSANTT